MIFEYQHVWVDGILKGIRFIIQFDLFKVQAEKRRLLEEVMALRKERSSLSSRASADSTGTPSSKVAAPSPNTTSASSVAPSQRSDESGDEGNQPEAQ